MRLLVHLNMKIILIIIWALMLMLSQACSTIQSDSKDFLLSKDLLVSYNQGLRGVINDFRSDTKLRVSFLSYVSYLAKGYWPVDNRAYLYTMAVDLYNSLPPDYFPNEKEYLRFNEDKSIPYKEQFFQDLIYLTKNQYNEDIKIKKHWARKTDLNLIKKEEVTAFVERKYIEYYLLHTVTLDRYTESASVDPESINLRKPVYYDGLVEFMLKNKENIDKRIAP